MPTNLQVLTPAECAQVHEKSLFILARKGVQIDSPRGRQLLIDAGAANGGGDNILCFPPDLVEASLKLAPRQFTLGGRRTGWSLPLNAGQSALIADGGAIYALDSKNSLRRPASYADWLLATRLTDALDDFGCYWGVVEAVLNQPAVKSNRSAETIQRITYWVDIFRNFSKHVQESPATPQEARWLKEILQVIFGSSEEINRLHPLSILLCPSSPLILEAGYTDAYLEMVGLNIPVAVMPMPLLGTTGPGTLISNIVLANCEALAMICLVQAAQPKTPVLYAPLPAVSNPHSGRYGGGEVEHALLGAAVTELARYYHLPVEASAGGTDHHVPGIQAGYERALNFILPVLSQPDLLVAPGLLGGSLVFSPEQFIIDLEIIHRCRRLSQGISTISSEWLVEIIEQVKPGGNFMAQRSTRKALHTGELYLSPLGCHQSYESWDAQGQPDILVEARRQIDRLLNSHQPIPFRQEIEQELSKLLLSMP